MSKIHLASLILAATLPLAAMAQGPAPAARGSEAGPPAGRSGEMGRGRGHMAEMTPEQRTQRTERHLAEMRTRPRITPAQMPQWEGFATATRENANEIHARFAERGAHMQQLNAAQNMDDYAQIAELHARQLTRLAASFTALYATFSPDQQRDADTQFRTRRAPGNSPAL